MLANDVIKLRAVEPQDIDFLFDVENDPKLWHVTQTYVPYSRYDIEQYVFATDKQDVASLRQVRFIVEYLPESKPVGTIDLFDLDLHNRRAGIGIVIIEPFRGKGMATMGLDLLMDYAFNHLNLHQLYCNVEEGNYKSLELFKKKGFIEAGFKRDWDLTDCGGWKGEFLLQYIKDH